VGQDDILPRIGNPPSAGSGITYGPIANRRQVTNLPNTGKNACLCWFAIFHSEMKVVFSPGESL